MPMIYCQDKISETIVCYPLLLYFIHDKLVNAIYLNYQSKEASGFLILTILSSIMYHMDDKMPINGERCQIDDENDNDEDRCAMRDEHRQECWLLL